ncbi:MFS transporter [Streptomyces sp. NPDC059534]|uniref:MFS transporter n=1 Tax=Streptomyces sp. NPDC059534 TaxID=3346859 RepID=UPI0036754870
MKLVQQLRSFDRTVQLLLINQFTISLGFYMLMPYLAQHLSSTLGIAAWAVGLILGVRNFSQQGMFLFGGTLADRVGYKPMIMAGLTLRTVGFAALGFVHSLPALLAASALIGLAGALFNPAVRAYLALETGERRVEGFALFNVFFQGGILLGPLAGIALTGISFQLTCTVSACAFAVLTAIQLRALPARTAPADTERRESVLSQWRTVVKNRPFLLFSVVMIGSQALSFQIYLAVPLELRRIAGEGLAGTIGVGLVFALSGLTTVIWQTRLTAWCKQTLGSARSLILGLACMAFGFIPPLAASIAVTPSQESRHWVLATVPILLSALLLNLGTMLAYPFEMDIIVTLADNRYVATHYGLYNTLCGIGIAAGNLMTGAILDTAHATGTPELAWATLSAVGCVSTIAIAFLHHSGLLTPPTQRLTVSN